MPEATRRTQLANERTQLAWWRTGLAALAVALGVGRVVPELDPGVVRWPYAVVGAGFALYGVALIAFGAQRTRAVDAAIAEGGFATQPRLLSKALTAAGVALGAATLALIILT